MNVADRRSGWLCAVCIATVTCLPATGAPPEAPETTGIVRGKDVTLHISRTTLCTIPKDLSRARTVVSADGKHVVVTARNRTRKYLAVIDGRPDKAYAGVSAVLFSPDSKHVAYSTCSENGVNSTVIDGVECTGLGCAKMLFTGPNTLHVMTGMDRKFVLARIRIAPTAQTEKWPESGVRDRPLRQLGSAHKIENSECDVVFNRERFSIYRSIPVADGS